jgi:hypothetical protein
MQGSHSSADEDSSFLGHYALLTHKKLPVPWCSVLPSSSGLAVPEFLRSATIYWSTWCNIPEDSNLHIHDIWISSQTSTTLCDSHHTYSSICVMILGEACLLVCLCSNWEPFLGHLEGLTSATDGLYQA